MSYIKNADKYIELYMNFINFHISAPDFTKQFSYLWESDRDELYDRKKYWVRPFDVELINELTRGEISKDEFNKRWAILFGLTSDVLSICDILDRTYTACNCFWPNIPDIEVDPPLILNEKLFRVEIAALLSEFQCMKHKMDQGK